MADDITDTTARLLFMISQVTADEFFRHDSHYNQDSRLGRELLYLIANDDWVRSTTEVINLSRSDAVDTTVTVNVDLSQITHEAFRDGAAPVWLPLLLLPVTDDAPPASPDDHDASAGQLTVTDADGTRLAPLRDADVWHAISAALAEIIVTMAVGVWPWPDKAHPTADRDQRLVLSAALFRLLSGAGADGTAGTGDAAGARPDPDGWREVLATIPGTASQLSMAKRKLVRMLGQYIDPDQPPSPHRDSVADPAADARMLVERTVRILHAFTQAIVVVVGVDRGRAPTVFSVTAPTRKLESPGHEREADRPAAHWRLLSSLQPRVRLEIDLLLASSDADRQVEINVPDGLSIDARTARQPSDRMGDGADLVVVVDPPPAADRLATLIRGVLAQPVRAIRQGLTDLSTAQADALAEVLSQHYALVEPREPDGKRGRAAVRASYAELSRKAADEARQLSSLQKALLDLASPDADTDDLGPLREAWGDGRWLHRRLLRRATISVPSPDTMTGQVRILENTRQRVTPQQARVTVPVEIADAQYFSIARFSGTVSALLMFVVGCFFAFALLRHKHEGAPSPEVIASALTLFSVIQAGRVEAPDRSTLRGKLTGAGNWLIIASILPTVLLAVALAFDISGWAPVIWSLIAIGLQGFLLATMRWGPLSAAAGRRRPPARVLRTTPKPDYGRIGVLHDDWWRTATASALLVGRRAHAYLIWEHHHTDTTPVVASVTATGAAGAGNGSGGGDPSHAPLLGRLWRQQAGEQTGPVQADDPADPEKAGEPTGTTARETEGGSVIGAPRSPSLPSLLGLIQPQLAAMLARRRRASSSRADDEDEEESDGDSPAETPETLADGAQTPEPAGAGSVPAGNGQAAGTAAPSGPRAPHLGKATGRATMPGWTTMPGRSAPGAGSIPNILAMLRSGTANEALTFVVLRERAPAEPTGRQPSRRFRLTIDPDRLAPSEAVTTHVDVLVGVPRDGAFPLIAGHPLVKVLKVAKDLRLPVVDVQVPVPPPDATPSDQLWARIRVGIRAADYPRGCSPRSRNSSAPSGFARPPSTSRDRCTAVARWRYRRERFRPRTRRPPSTCSPPLTWMP